MMKINKASFLSALLMAVTVMASQWSYIGCFSDNTSMRTLPFNTPTGLGSRVTVVDCLTACAAQGFGFCGMENGNECWAGYIIGSAASKTDGCDMACSGDGLETCGGTDRLTVYGLGDSVPLAVGSVLTSVMTIVGSPTILALPSDLSTVVFSTASSFSSINLPAPSVTSTAVLSPIATVLSTLITSFVVATSSPPGPTSAPAPLSTISSGTPPVPTIAPVNPPVSTPITSPTNSTHGPPPPAGPPSGVFAVLLPLLGFFAALTPIFAIIACCKPFRKGSDRSSSFAGSSARTSVSTGIRRSMGFTMQEVPVLRPDPDQPLQTIPTQLANAIPSLRRTNSYMFPELDVAHTFSDGVLCECRQCWLRRGGDGESDLEDGVLARPEAVMHAGEHDGFF